MMKQPIRDGFSLVWRHQRIVWWIFFVNLFLGFLASVTPRTMLSSVLDKSIYSHQLGQRFDLDALIELFTRPDISAAPWLAGSLVLSLIFVFYMLFISGGVLSVYHQDRKLTRGQFFEFSGDFFWRMIRLLLCSIIPFAIVFGLLAGLDSVTDKMASNAPREMQGFWVQVIGSLIVLLIAMFVRAWFDLAQARTVIDHVRGMFVLTFRSFVMTLRNLPGLLWIYVFTTIIAALVAVATWYIWLTIPHTSFGASWLLLELVTLFLVGIRLWQRASVVVWYENYSELHAPPIPVPPAPLPSTVYVEQVEVVTTPAILPSPKKAKAQQSDRADALNCRGRAFFARDTTRETACGSLRTGTPKAS
jgi:hypothetical protein